MYESTSEGTPLSPAFKVGQEEELAQWLEDNNASAFGNTGATKEQWLATIRCKYAVGMVSLNGQAFISGVAYNGYRQDSAEK